jgi:hypothetical protein
MHSSYCCERRYRNLAPRRAIAGAGWALRGHWGIARDALPCIPDTGIGETSHARRRLTQRDTNDVGARVFSRCAARWRELSRGDHAPVASPFLAPTAPQARDEEDPRPREAPAPRGVDEPSRISDQPRWQRDPRPRS